MDTKLRYTNHNGTPWKNGILFYTAYFFYVGLSIINYSFYGSYVNGLILYCELITLGMLSADIILSYGVNWKTLAIVSLFAFLSIISIWVGRKYLICIFAFVISGRNKNIKTIMKITAYLTGFCLLFVILSSYLGIIENYSSTRGSNGALRKYLGFRYALYAPTFHLNLIAAEIYRKREKIKVKEIGFHLIIAYFLYKQTDSRLCFMLSVITLLFCLFMKKWPKFFSKRKIVWRLACLSFIILSGIIIYLSISYNSSIPWMARLNKALGTRLDLGHTAIEKYGFSLFGNRIEMLGHGLDLTGNHKFGEYFYIDSLYVQMLVNYGVPFFIVYLGIFTGAAIWAYRRNDYWIVFLLTILAIQNVIDDKGLAIEYSAHWFVISMLMNKKYRMRVYKQPYFLSDILVLND